MRSETLLLVALGALAWVGPAASSPFRWFRLVTALWCVVLCLATLWFLPFTWVALAVGFGALGTSRPDRGEALRALGVVLAGTGAAVAGYVLLVVPEPPSDLYVCLGDS